MVAAWASSSSAGFQKLGKMRAGKNEQSCSEQQYSRNQTSGHKYFRVFPKKGNYAELWKKNTYMGMCGIV